MCALALLAVATARPPGNAEPRAAAGPRTTGPVSHHDANRAR